MSDTPTSFSSITTFPIPHDDIAFRASIRGEIRKILRERLPATWSDESRYIEDLGLDSLDLVEMVARLEQMTGVFVPDDDVGQLASISTTAAYIRDRRLARSPTAPAPRREEASP